MMSATGINNSKKLIQKRFKEMKDLYDILTQNTKVCLKDLSFDPLPEFYFDQFGFLVQWEKGSLSADSVLKSLNHMNFTEAAETKLLREFKRIKLLNKEVLVNNVLDTSIDAIKRDIQPQLEQYLNLVKRLFTAIVDVEKSQPPIILARFKKITEKNEKNNISYQEVTPDQAYKIILHKKWHESNQTYIVNNHMIVFEERSNDVKYVNWIIADKNSIQQFKQKFKLTVHKYFDTPKNWLESISEQLGAKI